MKNYLYTFLAFIVFSFSAHAQTELALCDAVKKIKTSQANFFKDLEGEIVNMGNAVPKAYHATISVQGAERSYISAGLKSTFYVSYGPYNTAEEAEKKAAELETQFLKCQSYYAFSKYRDQSNMISWVGYEKLKSGRRDGDVLLEVLKNAQQEKFYVQLGFKGGVNNVIYHGCSGKADSASDFGRTLFQILQDVKSDFSNIGGKVKDNTGGVASYEVNVSLPGSSSSEILGILGREYSAIYYSGNAITEAEKTWNAYTTKVIQTLGSAYEYTISTDKDGMKNMTFYRKDYYQDVKAGGVEVKISKYEEGTYVVYIKVHHNFMRL